MTIRYARTDAGLELPIVDVTHPAFRLDVTPAEQDALVARFVAEDERLARMPRLLRRALVAFFLRGSVLARGLRKSRGSYLAAIDTYLLKLGGANLGPWAKAIDRRIADSLAGVALRLRLQDMAQLMAETAEPALRDGGGHRTLHFLNLAGGTALDTINALILLSRKASGLVDRPIFIDVLDRDGGGPAFGGRALAALQAEGGPLSGVAITFRHVPWDWTDGAALSRAAAAPCGQNAVTIACSEGGLFEYGSDGEILDVLSRLRDAEVLAVVGSVTRTGDLLRRLHRDGGVAVRPRGLEVFRALVSPTGWTVSRVIERPFSDQVVLGRNISVARSS